jgi:hypothetical protein
MKTAIRIIFSVIALILMWVFILDAAYGVDDPTNSRLFFGMLKSFAMLFIGVYFIEPSNVNRRIYGIIACIVFYSRSRKYCTYTWGLSIPTKQDMKVALYNLTGCHNYRELYRYVSQEVYFRR